MLELRCNAVLKRRTIQSSQSLVQLRFNLRG